VEEKICRFQNSSPGEKGKKRYTLITLKSKKKKGKGKRGEKKESDPISSLLQAHSSKKKGKTKRREEERGYFSCCFGWKREKKKICPRVSVLDIGGAKKALLLPGTREGKVSSRKTGREEKEKKKEFPFCPVRNKGKKRRSTSSPQNTGKKKGKGGLTIFRPLPDHPEEKKVESSRKIKKRGGERKEKEKGKDNVLHHALVIRKKKGRKNAGHSCLA